MLTLQFVSSPAFCSDCQSHPQTSGLLLYEEAAKNGRAYNRLMQICRWCTGHRSTDGTADVACDSLDCPIMYLRISSSQKMIQDDTLLRAAQSLPKGIEW